MSDDLLTLPRCWNEELTTIASHTVLLGGGNGRIVGVMSAPGITEIQIKRVAISIELPKPWNGHFSPSTVVIAHLVEVAWCFAWSVHKVEFPKAVQREILLLQRSEVGMHRQSVDSVDLRVLPRIT